MTITTPGTEAPGRAAPSPRRPSQGRPPSRRLRRLPTPRRPLPKGKQLLPPEVEQRLRGAAQNLGEAASTSPGRIGLIGVVLVVVALVAGTVLSARVAARRDGVQDMLVRSGPLSVHAQEIYRALSDADATAAASSLTRGLEPQAMRQRYDQDIAQATSALAAAADLAGGAEASRQPLAQLSRFLPVYTGLVETARVHNRSGFPLGAAYLREASGVMRDKLLPAAERLYQVEIDRLEVDEGRAKASLIPDLLLWLALLGGLAAAQVYLTRRTNRLVNVGLAVATAAAVIGLAWFGIAHWRSFAHVDAAGTTGSDQVQLLAQARFGALEARADEGLTLVARGSGEASEKNYVRVVQELGGKNGSGGLLGQALASAPDPAGHAEVNSAVEHLRAWRAAHTELRKLADSGRYEAAVRLAIGADPGSTGSAFSRLDEDLSEAIANSQNNFIAEATQARGALSGLALGLDVLTGLIVIGVVAGVWRRLSEYW